MNYTIQELIPHAKPFLFVDSIEIGKDEAIYGYQSFEPDEYAVQKGEISPFLIVEALAQTMAAGKGLLSRQEGKKPPMGMLVGAEGFTFKESPVPGEKIILKVKLETAIGPYRIIWGEAFQKKALIAQGRLKFFLQENENK